MIIIYNFYILYHTRSIYTEGRSKINLSIFINTITMLHINANSSFLLPFFKNLFFNVTINLSFFLPTFVLTTGHLGSAVKYLSCRLALFLCFLLFS